jgi:ribosomal protein S18 acetylase RimI-like enzyme
MIIKVGKTLPFMAVMGLYESVGWSTYTSKPEALMAALENSDYVLTAWEEDELIGLARAVTDDVSIFYLQDLLVAPSYQRKGVGRKLLEQCLDRFSHVRVKALLTDDEEGQQKLYESMGFTNTKNIKTNPLTFYLQMASVTLE